MRALLFDESTEDRIKEVIQWAENHKLTIDYFLDAMLDKSLKPIGDNPMHVVHIPIGFRCVFSINYSPDGDARALSISVDSRSKGMYPSIEHTREIMKKFGFVNDIGSPGLMMKLEEEVGAIYLAELI